MGAALFSRGGHELEGLDLFSVYIVSNKSQLTPCIDYNTKYTMNGIKIILNLSLLSLTATLQSLFFTGS